MRDCKKHIEKYNKMLSSNNAGGFFVDDINQIKELSDGELYEAIEAALKVGYIVGYNRAKKEK